MAECVFCQRTLHDGSPTVSLTQKGCDGIQKASEARGNDVNVAVGQTVHVKFRKEFTNPLAIQSQNKRKHDSSEDITLRHALRSDEYTFTYKDNCIFCGCADMYNGRRAEYKLTPVRTMDFQDKILKACYEFTGEWADTIKARILYVQDLPAADAVYHNICNVNFHTGKKVPSLFQQERVQNTAKCKKVNVCGRPKDVERAEAFQAVTEYLENNDDEQITISDLINKMKGYLTDTAFPT